MSTEQNKAIVRRFFKEAFEQGNLALLDEILAPNSVNGGPNAMPGMPTGPEGANWLPDLRAVIWGAARGNDVYCW